MKKGIHPQYYNDAKIVCACGNSFTTGATVPEIKLDVCNKCHPFFTGEMKFVDTLGRVDKFLKSQEKAKEHKVAQTKKVEEKTGKARPSSLREMIELAKKQASS